MPSIAEIKHAETSQPIHELLGGRYSPYGYAPGVISSEDLAAVFEAARWAPSCFNEQPARYIVASRDNEAEFERMLACLVEPNREWAKNAGAVALGVVASQFARNGKDNAHARHDLGLASAQLSMEAGARGLAVHQMGGILPEVAVATYGIPEGYDVVTALAIGQADLGDGNERDHTPRARRPLAESVFTGTWGTPASFD